MKVFPRRTEDTGDAVQSVIRGKRPRKHGGTLPELLSCIRTAVPPIVLFLLLSGGLLSGCRQAEFESSWCERPVVIDGLYTDWPGGLRYFDKPSMFMGFRNDHENLYILIKTVDRRAQMKVMRLGLIVWFDPPGDTDVSWGVHYPIGLADHGIPVTGVNVPGDLSEERKKKLSEMLGEFEIVEKRGEEMSLIRQKKADSTGYGVSVAVRDTSGVIVFELKVPLHGNGTAPFTVISSPDGRVCLRLETGDIQPEKWASVPDDSLRTRDSSRNTGTGLMRDKGRRRDRGAPQLSPLPNPLTEPIRFRAEVSLADRP